MIKVYQRSNNDCHRAAVASLFEMLYEDVPLFIEDCPPDDDVIWWSKFDKWTQSQWGVYPAPIHPVNFRPQGMHLITAENVNGIAHLLVGRDGDIVFDPNPRCPSIRIVLYYTIFAVLDVKQRNEGG